MALQFITIVLISVALGTPLIVLMKSVRDLWRGAGKRSHILIKCFGALVVWFCVSGGMMFMLFATVFGAAHSGYRLSHGGAPNPSGSDDPTSAMVVFVLIYTLIGSSLVYFMLRRAKRPTR
jgi:uncharacterized BrkB/YihY/UPF0761 family membrane protein